MNKSIATLAVGILMTSASLANVSKAVPRNTEVKIPTTISAPKPSYPEIAWTFRMEGEVTVRVQLDAEGKPVKAVVVKSTSPVFENAVVLTVMNWRFDPSTLTDNGSGVFVEIPFSFKLKG